MLDADRYAEVMTALDTVLAANRTFAALRGVTCRWANLSFAIDAPGGVEERAIRAWAAAHPETTLEPAEHTHGNLRIHSLNVSLNGDRIAWIQWHEPIAASQPAPRIVVDADQMWSPAQ